MRIRLSGLGLTGEYACTIRGANGFASGNGRRDPWLSPGGVVGGGGADAGTGAEGGISAVDGGEVRGVVEGRGV